VAAKEKNDLSQLRLFITLSPGGEREEIGVIETFD
jgi:hypothetical protein